MVGVGVSSSEVKEMVDPIGCKTASFPFSYLGLSMGGDMKKKVSWFAVMEIINKKLTLWKANCLSFGGRYTLLNSVLSAMPLFLPFFVKPLREY